MTPPNSSPCSYYTSNSFDQKSCQAGEWLVETFQKLTQKSPLLVQKDPPESLDAFVSLAAGLAGMGAGAGSGVGGKLLARSAMRSFGKLASQAAIRGASAGAASPSGTTFSSSILFWPLLPFALLDDFPKLWGGEAISDTIARGLETLFGPAPDWLVKLGDDLGL